MKNEPVVAGQVLGRERRAEIAVALLHPPQYRIAKCRRTHDWSAVRSSCAVTLWLLRRETAPRSASSADSSAPATLPLPPAASCPPSPAPSLPPGSALACSIRFSPISVPPVGATLKEDISNVVVRGHF